MREVPCTARTVVTSSTTMRSSARNVHEHQTLCLLRGNHLKQAIVLILLSVTMLMVWNGKYPNSDWSRRYQEFTGSWSGPEIYAEVIYETNLLKKMYPGILPSTMGFTISNENHFEWTDVELTINSTLLSGGYTYQCTQIKANGATWAPAHEFSNAEGYRFDSDSMKPNTLIIQCATPNGRTSKKFEFQ